MEIQPADEEDPELPRGRHRAPMGTLPVLIPSGSRPRTYRITAVSPLERGSSLASGCDDIHVRVWTCEEGRGPLNHYAPIK